MFIDLSNISFSDISSWTTIYFILFMWAFMFSVILAGRFLERHPELALTRGERILAYACMGLWCGVFFVISYLFSIIGICLGRIM
ncbi:MAG TPA: hypothetical protein O0X18_00155 [Methanocorpusculum sp.]|nr:hypothetical protein [Methanocorpusculum sp.]